jgi:hypothetical protein
MDVVTPIATDSAAAVTVPGAGNTTIATITNAGKKLLCFHFDVVTQALDAFVVKGRAHTSAQQIDFSPAAWATPDAGGRIRRTNGNLAAVAAAGNGYFEMDIDGLAEITVQASAAADSAAVTPRWSLQ